MIYNTYQELVDKINTLLKEKKELEEMIDTIPLTILTLIIASKKIPLNKKIKWYKIYKGRMKNER